MIGLGPDKDEISISNIEHQFSATLKVCLSYGIGPLIRTNSAVEVIIDKSKSSIDHHTEKNSAGQDFCL